VAAVDPDYVRRAAGLEEASALPRTLEKLIAHRTDLLTQYQHAAYAQCYADFVEAVRVRENRCAPGSSAIAEIVARQLYKLMAYKDEYEVARLYSDGSFRRKIAETFEGDYRLQFNLAPPIFQREFDEHGRPRKPVFGAWMMLAFRALASLKAVRGTWIDPFARLPERREERALIEDYKALIEEALTGLTSANNQTAQALANIPDQVRGYGPVKATAIEEYRRARADLLHRFRNPQGVVNVQEVA